MARSRALAFYRVSLIRIVLKHTKKGGPTGPPPKNVFIVVRSVLVFEREMLVSVLKTLFDLEFVLGIY